MMNISQIATGLIIFTLILISFSLGAGLYYLVKDKSSTKRVAHALTVRVVLSLLLFFALWFAFFMGWISPHGL